MAIVSLQYKKVENDKRRDTQLQHQQQQQQHNNDKMTNNKRPTLIMLLFAILTIYSIAISTAISISDQSLSITTTATTTSATSEQSLQVQSQPQSQLQRNQTNYDHVMGQTKVKRIGTKQQQMNRSQSNRSTRHNNRQSSKAGKQNDIFQLRANLSKNGSSTTSSPANLDPFSLAQQEVRLMMSYNNTPPVFITSTRDFYVDVMRYPLGTKLATIKALDTDGDQLEYSLQPANVRDASAYFSIDSGTGELKLANKLFTFYSDPQIKRSSHADSDTNVEDEDDVDTEDNDANKETGNEDRFLDRNLYFLNVAAYDGRQTSVIEFQIHVTNSSYFKLLQSMGANSPVELTIEGSRKINDRLDSIIRKKTSDYYNGIHKLALNSISTNSSPSTIVYPSFINPGLVKPGYEQFSTILPDRTGDDHDNSAAAYITIPPPSDYVSTNFRLNTQPEHTQMPMISSSKSSKQLIPNISEMPAEYKSISRLEQPPSHTDVAALISQPMITSLVLICSCLMLTLVLLMFIVPISVKRLRKRLKNVELQHEHLSQQNSTGSSIICSSSSTTSSMACHSHNPSWQSQLTVDSDNKSSNFREGGTRSICRQSSLDSAITTANNTIVSPSPIVLNQRLFNRVNNGSIANPVYLQNHHQQDAFTASSRPSAQITSSLALPVNNLPIRDRTSQIKHCDNIYCPIDHDYSTINPDMEQLSCQLLQTTPNNQLLTCTTKDWAGNLNSDHHMVSQNPPQELFDRSIESPGSDSGSSIRSLIKFLSLPARHSTNTQDVSQLDTEFKFDTDDNNNNKNNINNIVNVNGQKEVVSKTIARASNISRERNDNQKWELERHKLKFLKPLDKGQFGMVWKCKLKLSFHSERTVAVKTLKNCATKDEREREELLAEIEIMKLVCNHPNVVKILHCCTTDAILTQNQPIIDKKPIYLVMEFVELGKLQSYLMESRANRQYATDILYNCGTASNNVEQNLTSRDLVKFIYHVAKGMEYISSQCIVHRDLASRNILVSSQKICKIGDFGMARHMQSFEGVYERHSRNTKVPVRWMAPEVLLNNRFTTESDVYSFGILMWEIVTLGSTPYKHLQTEQVIEKVARDGERPDKPEYCHSQLFEIMSKCWSQRPEERPTFGGLVKQLDEMLLSANNYIELDQYPDHNYYNIVDAPFELL